MLDQYTIEELLRILKAEADSSANDNKNISNICNVCLNIFEKIILENNTANHYRSENFHGLDLKQDELSFQVDMLDKRLDKLENELTKLSEKLNDKN